MSGHHETHIGLQRHSVGECYPLAVVGYQQGPDTPVVYTVENLATGEVMRRAGGMRPWQAPHADIAARYMMDAKEGNLYFSGSPPAWFRERPVFGHSGWLIFPSTVPCSTPIQVYNAVMEADNA